MGLEVVPILVFTLSAIVLTLFQHRVYLVVIHTKSLRI